MKSWCKVASNLDSHPKIRRAGRCGREVFLFALRRNAEPDNPVPGRLPGAMLEPWYLADQLMMSEEEAVTGVTACRHAGLLVQDGESWVIGGWDEGWGKKAVEGKDRTAKWREGKKNVNGVTGGDAGDVTQSHGDACDALDKKRLDKKRSEKKDLRAGKPDAPKSDHQRVVSHFHERYLKAYNAAPDWTGAPSKLISDLTKSYGATEVIARIDRMFDGQGPTWVKPPFTVGTLKAQWSALVDVPPGQPRQQSMLGGTRAGDLLDRQLQRVREAEEAERNGGSS